jgi:hypothetical protein
MCTAGGAGGTVRPLPACALRPALAGQGLPEGEPADSAAIMLLVTLIN